MSLNEYTDVQSPAVASVKCLLWLKQTASSHLPQWAWENFAGPPRCHA